MIPRQIHLNLGFPKVVNCFGLVDFIYIFDWPLKFQKPQVEILVILPHKKTQPQTFWDGWGWGGEGG